MAVILLPFLGTTFGAAMVFLMKSTKNVRIETLLLGFASGVMLAASVWSLILPSIEMTEKRGGVAFLPAAVGVFLGIAFLLFLDYVAPCPETQGERPPSPDGDKEPGGGQTGGMQRIRRMVFAVTLHNLPEGMAVGVTYVGAMLGDAGITMAGALTLSLGIAIQNFPEGSIISMPLKGAGMSKGKAFLCGVLSGVVEPIGAVVTILLAELAAACLPYLLAFAAGAMLYVVMKELIPESQAGGHENYGIAGAALGFVLMMVLDVALG